MRYHILCASMCSLYNLNYSLTHSLTHSLYNPNHSLTHSLTHSLYNPNHSLYNPNHSLPNSSPNLYAGVTLIGCTRGTVLFSLIGGTGNVLVAYYIYLLLEISACVEVPLSLIRIWAVRIKNLYLISAFIFTRDSFANRTNDQFILHCSHHVILLCLPLKVGTSA